MIDRVRTYAEALPESLGVRAVVVFGSVARGDFNLWSDIDVLVVADSFSERLLDRLQALEPRPELVQQVPWTPSEWRRQLARRNPIAVEALDRGVWVRGSAEAIEGAGPGLQAEPRSEGA